MIVALDRRLIARPRRTSGTFGELAILYRDHAKKKNKSWAQADALVTRHLLPRWSKLRPADIARSDVKAMMAKIDAPIVANQVLASASAIFTWGIREELVKVNPCVGIERNKTSSRERVLTDSEIPKFWNAFDSVGLVEGMALRMILLTGQRPGEIAHMRTEHIGDGWWEMPGDPVPSLDWPGTKNGHSHRVRLPQRAQDIITELEPTGSVFARPRGGAIQNLDAAMRSICKQLGVERATPHDLRRTFGTKVTGLGFGRDAMDRILNHKKSKKGKEKNVTDVYDRYEYGPQESWSRLSEQNLRVDKWSLCRG